jgi:hypothetical protein
LKIKNFKVLKLLVKWTEEKQDQRLEEFEHLLECFSLKGIEEEDIESLKKKSKWLKKNIAWKKFVLLSETSDSEDGSKSEKESGSDSDSDESGSESESESSESEKKSKLPEYDPVRSVKHYEYNKKTKVIQKASI